jgi:hypothetical protein
LIGHAAAAPPIALMKLRRRIAAPEAQGLCGLRYGMTQLQQGFTTGGMGSDSYFAWQQSQERMSALGQKQTSQGIN